MFWSVRVRTGCPETHMNHGQQAKPCNSWFFRVTALFLLLGGWEVRCAECEAVLHCRMSSSFSEIISIDGCSVHFAAHFPISCASRVSKSVLTETYSPEGNSSMCVEISAMRRGGEKEKEPEWTNVKACRQKKKKKAKVYLKYLLTWLNLFEIEHYM